MSQDLWSAVDAYLCSHLIAPDPILEAAIQSSVAAGLPSIAVTPTLGKFLHLLARVQNAKHILEIGTLAGYSSIWLARALPPTGRLITLEYDPKHAAVASANFLRAGLQDVIELRIGRALDTLPEVAASHPAPFDLIFIDADKQNNPAYFEWALKLSRPGSLIIVDNVIRDGAILDAATNDPVVKGVQQLYTVLHDNPRVQSTALQIVDAKGHDGFALSLVL
ncbi:MAG: O-methyltransferase [Candidatus Acidiferrum sp.]|jgi:predicted O-methyltransferase YrrM